MALADLEALEARALSNTDLDMKVTFIIPKEDPNKEIIKDIPSIPLIDECVLFDNLGMPGSLYRITSIIHHMVDNDYEVTCGLEKVEKSQI